MRRISTLLVLCSAIATIQNVKAQDCATVQPNTAACSGSVANDFNTNNTGFGATNGAFTYQNQRYEAASLSANLSTQTTTFTSPSYYKTNTLPGSVTAGILLTAGTRATITGVTLEVLDANTNNVISSCTPTGFVNLTGGSRTICISISDATDLFEGRMIRYRFRISYETAGNPIGERFIAVDDFSYGGNSNATLPVRISAFDVRKERNGARLTWNADAEINVVRYDIERGVDGRLFNVIGSVPAAGQNAYTFSDLSPLTSGFYRVKAVDFDGKMSMSGIIKLSANKSGVVLAAFPIPARGNVTLQHSTAAAGSRISLSTQDGRIVRNIVPAAGAQQTNVDLSTLQSGVYMIRFESGNGEVETLKIVKQ